MVKLRSLTLVAKLRTLTNLKPILSNETRWSCIILKPILHKLECEEIIILVPSHVEHLS